MKIGENEKSGLQIRILCRCATVTIGEWLKINGSAIYNAGSNPFWPRTFDWGTVGSKQDTLFLYVFNPETNIIEIEGFEGEINDAFINTQKGKVKVDVNSQKGKLSVSWSEHLNLNTVSVITLVTNGGCQYDKIQRQASNGKLFLTARAFQYSNPETKPMYYGFRNRLKVVGWEKEDFATAEIIIKEPGKYKLSIAYMAVEQEEAGSDFLVEINGQSLEHTTVLCDENEDFEYEAKELGEVNITKPGTYSITIRPKANGDWNGFGFQSILLERVN